MSHGPENSMAKKTKKTHDQRPARAVGSGTLVRRIGWKPINRDKLPKTGHIIAGSYRNGVWSMSSVSDGNGFPRWADDDRTHYLRLPIPPNDGGEPHGRQPVLALATGSTRAP